MEKGFQRLYASSDHRSCSTRSSLTLAKIQRHAHWSLWGCTVTYVGLRIQILKGIIQLKPFLLVSLQLISFLLFLLLLLFFTAMLCCLVFLHTLSIPASTPFPHAIASHIFMACIFFLSRAVSRPLCFNQNLENCPQFMEAHDRLRVLLANPGFASNSRMQKGVFSCGHS